MLLYFALSGQARYRGMLRVQRFFRDMNVILFRPFRSTRYSDMLWVKRFFAISILSTLPSLQKYALPALLAVGLGSSYKEWVPNQRMAMRIRFECV